MRRRRWDGGLLLFPVRRRLAALAGAYLCGLASAPAFAPPPAASALLALSLLAAGGFLLKRRRSALACAALALALIGNARVALRLRLADPGTAPGAVFSGTVAASEGETRVILKDVRLDGGAALRFPVRVTLMRAEGEETEAPLPGQRVAGRGRLFAPEGRRNPGGRDGRLAALSDGYWLSGYLLPGWECGGTPVFSPRRLAEGIQRALSERIRLLFHADAPMYCALLAGDRSGMESGVVSRMRETGIIHILTISGMHVSLIGLLLSRLLRAMRCRGGPATALALLGAGAYAAMTGFSPGTVRALLMLAIREYAALTGRRYDGLTALAAAFLCMTLARPALVFSMSFQYSFFIVLGLCLIGPAARALTERLPAARRIAGTAAFCLAAQIAAAPAQLRGYGYLPLLGVPMNLAIAFAAPLMIAGGMLCLGLSFLSMRLGMLAARPLAWLPRGIEALLSAMPEGSGTLLRLPAPSLATCALFAALLALLCPKIRFGRMKKAAAGLVFLLLTGTYALRFDPAPRYVQMDVGQGDAVVLRSGRRCVLYDTGPASGYDLLNYLRFEGLLVDRVILSHFDEDHAGGLLRLLQSEIEVGGVVTADPEPDPEAAYAVREAWTLRESLGVPAATVSAGDRFRAGDAVFTAIRPGAAQTGSNERSLVLLAEFAGTRILLTGDLPAKEEPGEVPRADILKVAHHGSKNASSRRFLEAASPAAAVIGVGAGNSYGHPAERVLEDLRETGAAVFRTDEDGCVTIFLREKELGVDTYLGRDLRLGRGERAEGGGADDGGNERD